MQTAPQIVFRGVESTPLVDDLINRGISKLEQVCDYIVSTRVAVDLAQKRHRTGNGYRMRIDVQIPQRLITVERFSAPSKRAAGEAARPVVGTDEDEPEAAVPAKGRGLRQEALEVLVRRSFESARRELEREVERQRHEVKSPAHSETLAVVEKVFREANYGFLRTLDGQQVYFHRNSVLHNHWDRLTVGTAVRYSFELGEKGPQATTVEPVDKPGVAEMHDRLHDLPVPPRVEGPPPVLYRNGAH